MKKKRFLQYAWICCLVACVTWACDDSTDFGQTSSGNNSSGGTTGNSSSADVDAEAVDMTISDAMAENKSDHEDDGDDEWSESDVIEVTLNTSSISVSPSTGTISGTTFTITEAGTYRITGTLSDGEIIVDTDDEDNVQLILNGVDMTSSTSSPLSIMAAEKAVIIVAEGTENKLEDADTYVYASADEDEPDAALFSKDDLSIYGAGTLQITAHYADGIAGKDGVVIDGPTITISSEDDGIRGKDYLVMKSGDFTITAGGDGLKSTNDEEEERGYIYITGGTFDIAADGDVMSAETDLLLADGTFDLTAGGGSSKSAGSSSTKGMKASVNLIAEGGDFTVSSADDCMHSNDNLVINGGTFSLASGDDGIHADATLGINGGTIDITKSYEGVESSIISITAGSTSIVSSDDGLNVAGGADSSGFSPGGSSSSGDYYLYMTGGYVYIDATGDGLDSNGSVVMSGGTIIINGPTASNNGAIDYDDGFEISGGFILAAGSSGMAQIPGTASSQSSILITFSSSVSSGTLVHLENSSGDDIFTFAPSKSTRTIGFSSEDLEDGSYKLYKGGSYSGGSETDGLYTGGTYTAGSSSKSFSISSVNTAVSF